eukprot:1105792-Rhodomonas_salina.1
MRMTKARSSSSRGGNSTTLRRAYGRPATNPLPRTSDSDALCPYAKSVLQRTYPCYISLLQLHYNHTQCQLQHQICCTRNQRPFIAAALKRHGLYGKREEKELNRGEDLPVERTARALCLVAP